MAVAGTPQPVLISKQMIAIIAGALVALFITFYDKVDITQEKWFVVVAVLTFLTSLAIVHEMPGITVLLFVLALQAIGTTIVNMHTRRHGSKNLKFID